MKCCLCTFLLLVALAGMRSAAPQTQPANKERLKEIRVWVVSLEDADPTVREKAESGLLRLERDELPMLKAAMQEFKPLTPAQISLLKEIVTHVYLTGDEYEKDPSGFLGIRMADEGEFEQIGKPGQVVIRNRMPGFGGFASLRDGDVILDILGYDLPQPLDRVTFRTTLGEVRPGKTVHLKVLRGGKVMNVPVKLNARPIDRWPNNPAEYENRVQELLSRRDTEAQAYWEKEFAPVIGQKPADIKTGPPKASN